MRLVSVSQEELCAVFRFCFFAGCKFVYSFMVNSSTNAQPALLLIPQSLALLLLHIAQPNPTCGWDDVINHDIPPQLPNTTKHPHELRRSNLAHRSRQRPRLPDQAFFFPKWDSKNTRSSGVICPPSQIPLQKSTACASSPPTKSLPNPDSGTS